MKKYVFSIFVQGILALSGFLVFLVSAKLFGAEGRGVISYGTAIFASLGVVFSFSLGRTFVAGTNQNEKLKRDAISSFLCFQILSIILAMVTGLFFWLFSSAAQSILHLTEILFLSLTSFMYVWSFNGIFFYASFVRTFEQERLILIFRSILIIFLATFYFLNCHNLTLFISSYSVLLAAGVISELCLLFKISSIKKIEFKFEQIKTLLQKSVWPHLDFLAFNLFPLILVVLSGWYMEKNEIGRVSFAIQIVNLIFLFSTTANLRISAYVSDVGYKARSRQLKKLFFGTISISFLSVIIIYFGLGFLTQVDPFSSFNGVSNLFLVSAFSIPGYILYQFLNPIWLELGKVKESAILNILNFVFILSLTPYFLKGQKELGFMILFGFFHIGLLITQAILYKKNIK